MHILTIWQKELKQFFLSPIAYVILVVFVTLAGLFYFDLFTYFVQIQAQYQNYQNPMAMQQLNVNDMIITPLFHNLSVLLLLIIPLVTMRLYAEERRSGTDEILLTSPVSESSIVWGKFLGAISFYLVALVLTAQFPLILFKYGNPDVGKLLTGYAGLFLMGASFIAFGLFTSTLAKTQTQAAIWSFFMLLILWIIGWLAESVTGIAGAFLKHAAIMTHFGNFAQGIITVGDLVYFGTFIFLFIFLATRVVESSRWR